MPSLFSKHLHLCFFKPKYPTILCHPDHETAAPSSSDSSRSRSSSSSRRRDSTEPDLASVLASQRFFFSSPGKSNSIVESPDSDSNSDSGRLFLIPSAGGGVGVPKYSLNPYKDFLRSMQDMLRSRRQVLDDITQHSDYLHQLLLCYLSLNPSHTHKYILRAFTDLLLGLHHLHLTS
ncbi:hypothetical protein Fmac_023463 [Flemingia macrophylla]|uniref:Transcription repressor n=1 Tax=Flemingia macrophylla TaxID=520843 RepID=A0ABD1LLM3_9FABA